MFELKPLRKDSIPNALSRAKRYRLLNEPWQAQSICRDILKVEPENQLAISTLILAITDQFNSAKTSNITEARELCKQLNGEYDKFYHQGLIEERLGKAAIRRTGPRVSYIAYNHYRRAMDLYAQAEGLRPEDNEDTVLRWNACVRVIEEFKLKPSPDTDEVQQFLE